MSPPIDLDAEVTNADWIKSGDWDFHPTPDYWETAPIAEIENLITLPAYQSAPAEVVEVIERRLAEVAD